MLIPTRCPLGGPPEADEELYPANFDPGRITPELFSARRRPDRVHYRMVRNRCTGCVRADPVLDEETIRALYRQSTVHQPAVTGYAARTYARYFERVAPRLPDRRGALEIGCADGAFLAHLRDRGFERVIGFEPSAGARAHADLRIAPHIVPGPLTPGCLPAESFSLACGFHVLDHLVDPNETLMCCREALMPGGLMFWACHDVGAWTARLLGERSPIVDIEHAVLYDRRAVARLFARNGFEVLEVFGVRNRYPLSYWAHLAPVPAKDRVLRVLEASGAGRICLTANLGNLGVVARKPRE